jgi:hypothetical protein
MLNLGRDRGNPTKFSYRNKSYITIHQTNNNYFCDNETLYNTLLNCKMHCIWKINDTVLFYKNKHFQGISNSKMESVVRKYHLCVPI